MAVLVNAVPCVIHEDEHLLVANKPAGLNTHAPSPYAGDGLHEWLRDREPRWGSLAIVHRLDKVTSGLILFAKSKLANQALTEQFATRAVRKRYLLLSDKRPEADRFTARTLIARTGEKYLANHSAGEPSETEFEYLSGTGPYHLIAAYPHTGRTHQIRVHAAYHGFPILGDELYGRAPFGRVCLHAEELALKHPATQAPVRFQAAADFAAAPAMVLREAVIEPELTNAYRVSHGEEWLRGVYVDRWGEYLLVEAENPPAALPDLAGKGIYFKRLNRQVQKASIEEASPRLVRGEAAPESFVVLENGVRFEISFARGYSVGLFLDQRENRRRLLKGHPGAAFRLGEKWPAGKEVLNTFAYTCGFSVCAALAGARCTSLDLSRNYLDWGQRNFTLNKLDPAGHDFVFGDVFDWVPRFQKKGRQFDVILLDPPTFSRSKIGGTFQAERDYGKLVKLVLPLLRAGGVLFASSNAAKLAPEVFRAEIQQALAKLNRRVLAERYVPQPPDFPITKAEPAYLKTIWLQLAN